MLTQVGSSLPGAAFACVSGGPGWWGAVGGGWISRCVRTWMRSVCMNGQGTSLKAGPKEIRTQFIMWQLESPLHLCVRGGRGGCELQLRADACKGEGWSLHGASGTCLQPHKESFTSPASSPSSSPRKDLKPQEEQPLETIMSGEIAQANVRPQNKYFKPDLPEMILQAKHTHHQIL